MAKVKQKRGFSSRIRTASFVATLALAATGGPAIGVSRSNISGVRQVRSITANARDYLKASDVGWASSARLSRITKGVPIGFVVFDATSGRSDALVAMQLRTGRAVVFVRNAPRSSDGELSAFDSQGRRVEHTNAHIDSTNGLCAAQDALGNAADQACSNLPGNPYCEAIADINIVATLICFVGDLGGFNVDAKYPQCFEQPLGAGTPIHCTFDLGFSTPYSTVAQTCYGDNAAVTNSKGFRECYLHSLYSPNSGAVGWVDYNVPAHGGTEIVLYTGYPGATSSAFTSLMCNEQNTGEQAHLNASCEDIREHYLAWVVGAH